MKNYPLLIGIIMTGLLLFLIFAGSKIPSVTEGLEGKRVQFPKPGEIITAPYPPSKEYLIG